MASLIGSMLLPPVTVSSSMATSSASTGKRQRDAPSRDANVLSIITEQCNDSQLGYLIAQQYAFTSLGEVERHDNTNNPGKGRGHSSSNVRLLNLIMLDNSEHRFPEAVKARLWYEDNLPANAKMSKTSKAVSLWTAVYRLACRVETTAKCLEKSVHLSSKAYCVCTPLMLHVNRHCLVHGCLRAHLNAPINLYRPISRAMCSSCLLYTSPSPRD